MYKTYEQIPLHVFSNRACTQTPSPELRRYLSWMLAEHPNDLEYLWRFTQQYVSHGGCYTMTFDRWLHKLERDLQKET